MNMEKMQQEIDAIMRFVTAATNEERISALEEVRRLMETPSVQTPNTEDVIREILLEIGAQDHLLGYPMVIEGVQLALENRELVHNITYELYPAIAKVFDSSPLRVEREIRNMIEKIWMAADPNVVYKFFGNSIDINKCKPTNAQFIARITNIARQRLKMA